MRGSFNAGFGAALGAIAALVIVAGISVAAWRLSQRPATDPATAASAKRYAAQALAKHDIRSLGSEAQAACVDGEWCVSGPALGRDNRLHDVFVSFRVATVGGTKRWQLMSVLIDGDAVVSGGESRR